MRASEVTCGRVPHWSVTKDVKNGAAKKSWELPMYDPGGSMTMRCFKRLNKHYYFFKEFILSQSVQLLKKMKSFKCIYTYEVNKH